MMMQESPGAAGIGSIGSADQFAGRYKDQQRSKANPGAEDQGLKCPRCDSPNTKFCYYNNYNLTQPRHFCKTCRRYWTKGGALRNVPIGGGCRKNKRPKQRTASKDRTPLIIALDHRENSSSPAANSAPAIDVSNGLSLLQNLWAPSGSNYLDLPGTDRVGLALARLQNHSNLLGPGVNGDGRYGHPSGGHMATLMFENPPAAPQDNVLAGVPSSSSAGMLVEGIAAAGSNFNFAGPESFDGNVTGAEDLMHWRIQQQSRLAMLQLAAADGQTVDANNNHNSGNNNNNNNNVDLLPISSVNDQNYSSNSGPQKGKSIISNDLQTRVNDYDGRPGPEWPAVADCLFEPQAVPGESTGGYWYGLQQLAEN